MELEGLQMDQGEGQCEGARRTYEVCFNSWLADSRCCQLYMVEDQLCSEQNAPKV